MIVTEEARRLVKIFEAQQAQLLNYLSGQLSVLKQKAQMLMGLCGLAITVTGFSGHHMAKGGLLPASMLVAGISFIFVAIVITLRSMRQIRWVSQALSDDLVKTTEEIIKRRNKEQKQLSWASLFATIGLGFYLFAVATSAFLYTSVH